ncbi:hypothetical protein BH09PAT1_BH09PAT1_4840 [soil metagenome]
MIYKKAEYKVKKEFVAKAEEIILDFIKQVHTNENDTHVYDAFLGEDGVSFTHFMVFAGSAAEEVHKNTSYVQEFVAALYPLCEVEPVFTRLSPIGNAKNF